MDLGGGDGRLVPALVSNLSGVASIAAGGDNSLALKAQSVGNAWGLNQSGELGNNSYTDSSLPVSINTLNGVMALSGGAIHSLALASDGRVWAWGSNIYGQLGNGSHVYSIAPVAVSNLTGVTAIASTALHNLALTSDGRVWTWGLNLDGQLGNGSAGNTDSPAALSYPQGVVAIAAGGHHSLALTSDGRVWAWGSNYYGELGNGTFTDSRVPVHVSSLNGVVAISAGDQHSLALTSDGKVWAWGANSSGQLGDGWNNYGSSLPVMVSNLSGVVALSAGAVHSLALTSDGQVWSWGLNRWGELGNGSNIDSNVPVAVSGLGGVVALSAGAGHSLALNSDGATWAWGYNQWGQLGNGSITDSSVPVESQVRNTVALAAGEYHTLQIGSGEVPPPSAIFQTLDSSTQGNWKSHYGADGYIIANDSNTPPSYATVTNSGAALWTWTGSTTDPRALVKGASATDRIASAYYSGSVFTFDVTLIGGPHQVALYLLDLDSTSSAETISILDPESNRVLDTRFFSNFHSGAYAIWTLQGHVLIRVANYGGLNAAISGVFFGPALGSGVPGPFVNITNPTPGNVSGIVNVTANAYGLAGVASVQFQLDGTNLGAAIDVNGPALFSWNTTSASNGSHSLTAIATDNLGQRTTSSVVAVIVANGGTGSSAKASFVKLDAAIGGTWVGVYGQNGYLIANDSSAPPSYATVSANGAAVWTWAGSTTDPRALLKGVSATDRIASTYYSNTTFNFDVNLTDGNTHQLALYCLDMDSDERSETISILDPVTHAVLDSRNLSHFHNGAYVVFNLQGRVLIQVTSTGAFNAVVSGIFFGSGSPADTPLPTVSFVTPVAGPVSGLISLNAHATSAAEIVSTSFVLDNTITLKGPDPGPGAFTDIDFGFSWYSGTVPNGPHTLTAIATDALGQTGSATVNIVVSNAPPSGAVATFVDKDTTTLGNWKGHYGQDGQIIANDTNNLPSYATAAWTGASQFSWTLTQDPRALQQTAGSARTASTFYLSNSSGDFSLDLNLTDDKAHQVALYFLDWDHSNRAEGVSIFDAQTQYQLDTRLISGFEQGAYLVWNISGHVTIRIQGANGVVSGVFIGPPQ